MKLKNKRSQTWYANSYRLSKTSGKTTLIVELHGFPSSSKISIFNPFLVVTLDTATYNCPCVKTGSFKYRPILNRVCPWLLFIVIAKHKVRGNCFLLNLKGIFLSDGDSLILWIKVRIPMLFPEIILTSITRFDTERRFWTCGFEKNLCPLIGSLNH